MRKMILTGLLVTLFNFTYAMDTHLDTSIERQDHSSTSRSTNTTTLISSRFFEESEARFRTHLESVLRSITEGGITPESAIVSICSDHRESLVMLRSSLNQGYLNQLEEQRVAQEELIRRITSEKEHEIQALQERLDTLLHASGSTSESFRIFNQERRHAEENVRRARAQAEQGEIPELVTERQVDRTSRRFSEQLDEIKREVQESRRTLEEAFERTQEKYGDNIDALIGNLQDRYEDILAGVTAQYNERRERIEEAYEQQKALMQRMIDEVASINLKLEKEKELADIIHGVYLSNPSNPFLFSRSFIGDNVQELRTISDLSQRRSRVEVLYDKFKLFSNIYGREDLGVKATASDLEAVKSWLEKTHIDVVLMKYGPFVFPKGTENAFSGVSIGQPLAQAKARLTAHIDTLESTEKTAVQLQLLSIFQRSAAEDSVSVSWTHPWFWGTTCTHDINYYKNGSHIGHLFQETTGGWWGESWGIFGYSSGHKGSGLDWNGAWNTCRQNFQQYLSTTIDAIKQRAMLLFDFETNPESKLQKLYKQAGIVPALTLPFPSMEIESLIKQCNDFIKRSVS